ncbi:MAG: hypothetical protein R3F16_08430 [Myxococcota bacterium]
MLRQERSAPIWLFSFVDLAFLLLIAFTQIGRNLEPDDLDLAQLEVPRIAGSGLPGDEAPADGGWQLRIHPVQPVGSGAGIVATHRPYELVAPGTPRPAPAPARGPAEDASATLALLDPTRQLDAPTLAEQLALLQQRRLDRPVLAPHRDSRSEDLLVAIDLLERAWPGERRVTVEPRVALTTIGRGAEAPTPPVAAAGRREDVASR